jgi:S-adenosylmethionine-diacylgycerolhomoserine-N-methlytransferase
MNTLTPTARNLQRYYAWHASIYDATRWTFLHGRSSLLRRLETLCQSPSKILEIGCGTGRNLRQLQLQYPKAQLVGVDLSADMLARARKRLGPRVQLHERYDEPVAGDFDLVICSYSLSMFNPGWFHAVHCAQKDLATGGQLAFVDFHCTGVPWFKQWMSLNHVRMDGHIRTALIGLFHPQYDKVATAACGLWEYHTFIGEKR